MSHPTIYTITQDGNGFLWFGAPNGINIYDGYHFKGFRYRGEDVDISETTNTSYLTIDRGQRVWIGTWGEGLYRIDPARSEPDRFLASAETGLSHDRIQVIFQDRSGTLWVGTNGGGLNRFHEETGSFSAYEPDPNKPGSLSSERIWSIFEDLEGALWLGTSKGLNRFDPKTGEARVYRHDPERHDSLSHDEVRCVLGDRAGRLWVGTREGLNLFVPQTDGFVRFYHMPGNPDGLENHFINALYEDRDSILWVGTISGLSRMEEYDREGAETPRFTHVLPQVDIRSIHQDRSGLIWIGSRNTGVYKLRRVAFRHLRNSPENPDLLTGNFITAFYVAPGDREGGLWIGTSAGLNRMSRDGRRVEHFRHNPSDPDSLADNDIFTLLGEGPEGATFLWVGTASTGLDRYDPRTGRFTHFRHDPQRENSLCDDRIRALLLDGEGMVWIGTNGGLNRYDPRERSFLHFRSDPDSQSGLDDDRVRCLFQDRESRLWVGTSKGLNFLDRGGSEFARIGLPQTTSVRCLLEVEEGDGHGLWIGTGSAGLFRLDREDGALRSYGKPWGSGDGAIFGMLADSGGQLWLSSHHGLARFDSNTQSYRSYDVSHGLQDIQFNRGAYFKGPEGELYFGGLNGLNVFMPGEVVDNDHRPPVFITGLSIRNQDRGLDLSSAQEPKIELSYKETTFSLELAALDFVDPDKNRYAYKLEGADEDWVHLGNRRFVTFSKLKPGTYRFRAKAANSDGYWNENGAAALIAISPPPWATMWAYGAYGLMLFGLVWTGHNFRVRGIEKRKRELELLVQKRTRELKETNEAILQRQNQLVIQEKMASLGTLAAGIAHEIKNPLNFVNNFAVTTVELLDDLWRAWKPQRGKIDKRTFAFISELLNSLEQNAGIINKHGRKADAIVQSMMDLARIEPGNQRDTDLNLLVTQYTQLAYHGVKVKDESIEIAIELQLDDSLPPVRLAPQSMSRAIINVVNNAIDGVLEKQETAEAAYRPEIKVRTANLADWVEIRFRDNGIGIPQANLDRVLTPFFTTKSPGGGNIGLGLSICFDIVVQEHGGSIKIFSQTGVFTELAIRLPLTRKRFSDEDGHDWEA